MKKTIETKIKRLFMAPFASWLPVALIVAGAVSMLVLLRQNRAHDFAEAQRRTARRNAAIAGRAKLAADMMGVLFSDAQTGLLATLNTVPREGTLPFLERWREINPLISDAAPVNARGIPEPGPHWPDEMAREYKAITLSPALKDWLAKTPWLSGAVAEKQSMADAGPDTSPAVNAWGPLREKLRAAAARAPYHIRGNTDADFTGVSSGSVGSLPHSDDYTKVETWSERRRRLGIPFTERAGWDAAPGGLYAWRMCDDDIVLAVSVNLRELAAMLAAALPEGTQNDEEYSMVIEAGRARGDFDFVHDVPVHSELLSGWAVRGIGKKSAEGAFWFSRDALHASATVSVVIAAALGIALLLVFQRRMRENEIISAVTDYASHEMGTDVQEILCCTDPDALSVGGEAHVGKGRATMIYYAAQRLSETIALVLEYSPRIIRGKKIRIETVDLCEVAQKLQEEFQTVLQKTGLKTDLDAKLPAEPVHVTGNGTAVSIILRNLIDNACLHSMSENRSVEVSLVENTDAGVIGLCVRDYGHGVSRETLAGIFKPRWRPAEEEERGHGVGLPLCRKLARALGGDLTCEIPADGAGGRMFVLSLGKHK